MMSEFDAMRAMVRNILESPLTRKRSGDLDWTVQGFGMLRTYLDKDKRFRLNIWDVALSVPNVSLIHDHHWSFDSWIISGEFVNTRFLEEYQIVNPAQVGSGEDYDYTIIKTGEGGGPDGERHSTRLFELPAERYLKGNKYHQDPTEIHFSAYADGTVTLNDRTRVGDGEHARVFWPAGTEWVDAMPRRATETEVLNTVSKALERW